MEHCRKGREAGGHGGEDMRRGRRERREDCRVLAREGDRMTSLRCPAGGPSSGDSSGDLGFGINFFLLSFPKQLKNPLTVKSKVHNKKTIRRT